MATQPKLGVVNVRPEAYWGVLGGYMLIMLLTALLWADIRWPLLAVLLVHVGVSWRVLDATEMGGIFLLGIPVMQARVGPNFVLFGLMSLEKFLVAPHQKHLPEEPDLVFRGDDKEPLPILPDGRLMVRPIRILSGRPRDDYDGPLNIQATAIMTGTVRYYPEDFFALWIHFRGSTAEEKFEELERQLEDTFVRSVKGQWQVRPAGLIVDDDDEIRDNLEADLEKETQTWGIRIDEVNLYSPDFGHDLNKQLTGIGEEKAKQDQELAKKEQTKTKAEADRYAEEQAGLAEAAVKLAKEKADTDAAAYRARKLKMSPREVIALEAVPDILGDKDKFFFGANGIVEALTAGTVILDAMKNTGGSQPAADPAE